MTAPGKDVKNLLAELDADFGKKARAARADTHKELNKTFHQRTNTGDYRDEVAYANAASRSWKDEPGWRPVATVHRVHHQHCRTCLQDISYIANEFTRFRNARLRSQVDAPETGHVDDLGFPLPQVVTEHSNEVEYCAACLRLSRRVDDLADAIVALTGRPLQQPLWG